MPAPDKHGQDMAIGRATTTNDDEADIIRAELNRRADFDKRHKKTLTRLLTQPEARESDQAWQRKRVAGEAAEEIERRMTFDENHPRIYKTAEERQQAYAVFNPTTALDQRERSDLRLFKPSE